MNNGLQSFDFGDHLPPQEATGPVVIFFGSKVQFPDCICRLIESEIEGTKCRRVSSAAQLALAAEAGGLCPNLIVIDDSLWVQVDQAVLTDLRLRLQSAVAIAFRDTQLVVQLALHRSCLPKGIGFLPMDLNLESWLTIVRLLLTGYPFLPSELVLAFERIGKVEPAVTEAKPGTRPRPTFGNLTSRESEVLKLVAKGLQNKHIAEELDLSEHTVKLHVHNLIAKLGARNRTDAALRYRQQDGV